MSTNVALVMTLLQMVGSLVMMVMCVFYSSELKCQGEHRAAAIVSCVTTFVNILAQIPGLALLFYYY